LRIEFACGFGGFVGGNFFRRCFDVVTDLVAGFVTAAADQSEFVRGSALRAEPAIFERYLSSATALPRTNSLWSAAAVTKPGDQISYYIKATPKKVPPTKPPKPQANSIRKIATKTSITMSPSSTN